jgi:hypothetical protein
LVIEPDRQEHRAIKAKALLLGISMKECVLQKLRGSPADVLKPLLDVLSSAAHLPGSAMDVPGQAGNVQK